MHVYVYTNMYVKAYRARQIFIFWSLAFPASLRPCMFTDYTYIHIYICLEFSSYESELRKMTSLFEFIPRKCL